MNKLSADTIVPGLTLDLIKDRLMRFGPPAFATGAGLAAVSHLMSLHSNAVAQQDAQKKDNTLVIQIPQKTAGPSFGQYAWDAPLVVGSAMAAGGAGYAVIDSILKKYRQKQMDDELGSVKKQYAGYLGQELAPKQASEYPTLDGILLAVTEQIKDAPVEPTRKEAALNILKKTAVSQPTAGTMFASLSTVPALLAAVAAHQYYYSRQKDVDRAIEDEEAKKMQKTPQYVKIVSAPQQPDQLSDPNQPKMAGEEGGILEGAIAASLMGKGHKPEPAVGADPTETNPHKRPIFSDRDVTEISPQTTVLQTNGGDVQLDALDPQALAALEKHKEQILKSFALGANTQ